MVAQAAAGHPGAFIDARSTLRDTGGRQNTDSQMALTLGLTGMDPATEASLKVAFDAANARLGGVWKFRTDGTADHVIVDMDSMYGPMSWLRLHADGKVVIGLTSAPRTQADHRLAQPFDAGSLQQLLVELAPDAVPAQIDLSASDTTPSGLSPAPRPDDQLPEEQSGLLDEEIAAPAGLGAVAVATDEVGTHHEPASAAAGETVPAAPSLQPHTPASAPQQGVAEAVVPVAAEPRTLVEWLASGRVGGRVGFERDGVTLLLDLERREYFGPATLKPLATHVTSDADEADFVTLPDWTSRASALGDPQPLTRLLWFGGLKSSEGRLLPGFDPDARYLLLKWPQTEREFPRHFRIATVMMKGPATLPEIAEASGVTREDVTDFVNANLATGFAEVERPPEPEIEPARKATGLFGRLRGR